MNPTIIAAIIGAFATIGASASTFLFPNIKDLFRPKPKPKISPDQDRKYSLTGDWEGTVRRDESLGEPLEMNFSASLESIDPMMQGEGKLSYKDKNENITQRMSIQGEFIYERFLVLKYNLKDHPGLIQLGRVMLEFNPDGKTLDGRFTGFSAINRGIVWGTVHTERKIV